MPNLSTLFPSVAPLDVYEPLSQYYDGTDWWRDDYTSAGNKVTIVCRFKQESFTGGGTRTLVRACDTANTESRMYLSSYASDHATPGRQDTVRILVQNTVATQLWSLWSLPSAFMDNEWHTAFCSYDADNGEGVFVIDGEHIDDTGNAERVAPVTGTLNTGTERIIIGNASTASFYPYTGDLSYVGYHEVYLTDWTQFMESDGTPKQIDETTWVAWGGTQPKVWNEHGHMGSNKGSSGLGTQNGVPPLSPAILTRSGILTYPNSISTEEYAIVNPSAEAGDYTTGWTLNAGTWGRSSVQVTPHEGTYVWYIGNALSGHIYQDILAVSNGVTRGKIDGGGVLLIAGYHGATYNGQDNSRLKVEFYDGTPGSLISTLDSGYLAHWGDSSGTPIWWPVTLQGLIPAGTVTLRMSLMNARRNGTACNGYMDSIFMRANY